MINGRCEWILGKSGSCAERLEVYNNDQKGKKLEGVFWSIDCCS